MITRGGCWPRPEGSRRPGGRLAVKLNAVAVKFYRSGIDDLIGFAMPAG